MQTNQPTIRQTSEGREIFDPVRKKFVALTPEEFVRQNLIQFLHNEKGYPLSLMRVEVGLKLNGMQKRCDILLYNRRRQPLILVECKAASVKISQNVFDQIARYNITLRVPYIVVSNGEQTFCCKIDFENNDYAFLKDIPKYDDICEE